MHNLNLAQQILLDPNELGIDALPALLARAKLADYADCYFQHKINESWALEDGIVKDSSSDVSRGVGVRVISGERVGFAYSADIAARALQTAVDSAASICRHGGGSQELNRTPSNYTYSQASAAQLYASANPLNSRTTQQKVDILQSADSIARSLDSKVVQVFARLSASFDCVLISNSQQQVSADLRPMVRLDISVIVEHNGKREQAHSGGGGRVDYQYFDQQRISGYCQEAVRVALLNLEAVAAPAGQMPVVLGAGWAGVLLHEAVGHGLEGDFNRKGTSNYSGRIGEQVASKLCTIVDDGTIAARRGSLSIDDEGVASQNTVLIENGILKNYMQDRHNAALMGMQPTGNGRRQSFAHLPMPRMTNTYMLAGKSTHEEMIASVDKGIYAANFSGGQVDISSGQFVFSASEAYLIERGKITAPIKGATLIGNGPTTMSMVSMVGDNLALDTGVGICGKNGQSVPVGVGQPSLKIDQLTVGGTAA